ncbi:MAG: hypothetical protein H7Y13_07020 [Sphingobacteriaceae bacterium]|nr:hypothetical protein [Sphingobacteriaceae bacterium]
MQRFYILFFLGISVFRSYAQQEAVKPIYEKVYLHTDRESYSVGEDIWFKAYLVNAKSNLLTSFSNNLFVELISPEGSLSARKIIRLENGAGHANFQLSDTIPGGKYKLRAYTNWMRNFENMFFFEKEVHIYNEPQKGILKTDSIPRRVGSPSIKNHQNSAVITNRLVFYPEGGSLIEGIPNIIAFKAERPNGNGLAIKASIVSSAGDTIDFSCNRSGFGRINLKPVAGITYTAYGKFADNESFKVALPAAVSYGIGLNVRTADTVIRVILSANQATFSRIRDKKILLVCRQKNDSKYVLKKAITSDSQIIEIPKSKFSAGIVTITVYDPEFKPQAERLVYVDRKPYKLELVTDKPGYKARQIVDFGLRLADENNNPLKANLSLAAVDATLVPDGIEDIAAYLMLRSEVKGRIDSVSKYFDSNNPHRLHQLDLLLMTQGWRDYIWKSLPKSKTFYHPEKGFTISGTVRQVKGDAPSEGMNITLFVNAASGEKLFATTTGADGRFYFDGIYVPEISSMTINSVDRRGKKSGWITLDTLQAERIPLKINLLEPDTEAGSRLSERAAERLSIIRKEKLSDTVQLKDVIIKSSTRVNINGQFLLPSGYPDQSFAITPEDYDFRNLRHFLLTRVKNSFPDTSMQNGVLFQTPGRVSYPRFIVDRKLDVFDRLDYYELAMQDIEKVVVKQMVGLPDSLIQNSRKDFFQARDAFLIYLTLKPSAYSKRDLSYLNKSIQGYDANKVFYSPSYADDSTTTQRDLRATIHWAPALITDKNGEVKLSFYNSDVKARVKIIVQGLSEDGIPLTGSVFYDVN